jgi:hypothetical protein
MSGKQIKQIDIVLENCEVISVPGHNLLDLRIGELHGSIHVQGIDVWNNHWTNYCKLQITKAPDSFVWTNEGVTGERTALDRLKVRDITHLDLIYDDNSNFYLGLPWRGFSDFHNKLEKWSISETNYTITWNKTPLLRRIAEFFNWIAYSIYKKIELVKYRANYKRELKRLENEKTD